MNDIFKLKKKTHMTIWDILHNFLLMQFISVFNGSGSASYLGPKMREEIPFKIKNINKLVFFF